MKKMFVAVLALLMTVVMGTTSYASTGSDIMPLWDNIKTVTRELTFDGDVGTVEATVRGLSGTTEITISLIVYRQSGENGLFFIDSVTETFENSVGALSLDFDAEPGETYEASVRVTVTRNGVDETELFSVTETC